MTAKSLHHDPPEAHPLTIELRPISTLTPEPRNARQHPQRHLEQLARSIQTFGFTCPILIDAHGHVIAGHGRLLAVQFLGWSQVPTITLEHLTPAQVRAYRIADNRLTDCSVWDERLLAEELQALSALDLDFDLTAIGFELPEIDLRIQGLSVDEEEESPPAGEAELQVVSVLGDVWLLGRHRIVCGNALDADAYSALLGSTRAAMVITDMPYNVPISGFVCGNGQIQHREFAMASGEMTRKEFTAFLSQALGLMKQSVVPGALLYAFMDWRHAIEILAAAEAQGLEQKNLCIWDKGVGGMGSLYRSQHELVYVFKAGEAKHTNNIQLGRFGRNRSNVWAYPGVNSFARDTSEGNLLALHPTTKPTALIADAILDASERGEAILDPFLGSGTTIIAAEKTGRIGLGIELDPLYVDVAVRRWQRLTGQHAMHASIEASFDEIAARRSAQTNLANDGFGSAAAP